MSAMKRFPNFIRLFILVILAGGLTTTLAGQPNVDWPQWQGPDRTGLSKEVGLLKQWPASGPPVVWSASNVGAGYGSIAIKGERIFLQGSNGRQSIVYSLNRADGRNVWSKALGDAGSNDRG